MIVVLVGWVFFRAENIGEAGMYLKDLFTVSFAPLALTYHATACVALILGIALCLVPDRFLPDPTSRGTGNFSASAYCLQAFLAVLSIAFLLTGARNPFIYFNF